MFHSRKWGRRNNSSSSSAGCQLERLGMCETWDGGSGLRGVRRSVLQRCISPSVTLSWDRVSIPLRLGSQHTPSPPCFRVHKPLRAIPCEVNHCFFSPHTHPRIHITSFTFTQILTDTYTHLPPTHSCGHADYQSGSSSP